MPKVKLGAHAVAVCVCVCVCVLISRHIAFEPVVVINPLPPGHGHSLLPQVT